MRRWRRSVHRSRSLGQRFELLYTTVIGVGILGPLAYGIVRSTLTEVGSSPSTTARWGPPALLAALLTVARSGVVGGPVVFSLADVAYLLGAPLSRQAVVAQALRRAFAVGRASVPPLGPHW